MRVDCQQAIEYVRAKVPFSPTIGVILGSGLGDYADAFADPHVLPYAEIPNFPRSTVVGHKGRLVFQQFDTFAVVVMQGRFHYYEGYSLAQVTFPIRVLGALGIRRLIVTNAAGGINPRFRPGDLMLITDHINLMGVNPLCGPHEDSDGPRFPDMTEAYNHADGEILEQIAGPLGIGLQEGVYAGLSGPSYETPAEIRMLRTLGADAVGMSTVPEVIVANQMGLRVSGISCISNMAAGMGTGKLSHQEVMETSERVKTQFIALLDKTIQVLGHSTR